MTWLAAGLFAAGFACLVMALLVAFEAQEQRRYAAHDRLVAERLTRRANGIMDRAIGYAERRANDE